MVRNRAAHHIGCIAKQMTGFFIERNNGLKWVQQKYINLTFPLRRRSGFLQPFNQMPNEIKEEVRLRYADYYKTRKTIGKRTFSQKPFEKYFA